MKRFAFIASLVMVFSVAYSGEKTTIIRDILTEYAAQKVDNRQELIQFSDQQAKELKQPELNYLLEVKKAENCRCCNTANKIKKSAEKRDSELQKILTREQYLKYEALDKNRIKKHPLRAL